MNCRYCGGKVTQLNGAPPTCEDCKKTFEEQIEAESALSKAFKEIFHNTKGNESCR